MKKIIVWDLPIRLFHLVFAGSLSAALVIGFLVDDDSPLFQWHMLLGLVAAFALVVRIILGVAGSRHNRFADFPLRPGEVTGYLLGVATGKARRYIGHNPGGAIAALMMFVLVPLLVASGAGWLGETGEELHEPLAIGLLVVTGAHIAGIIWHTVRHKEPIAMSMVTGRKEGPEAEGLASSQPAWAVAILVAGVAWVGALFSSHDPLAETVELPLIGKLIDLGEGEGAEQDGGGDDHDDD